MNAFRVTYKVQGGDGLPVTAVVTAPSWHDAVGAAVDYGYSFSYSGTSIPIKSIELLSDHVVEAKPWRP